MKNERTYCVSLGVNMYLIGYNSISKHCDCDAVIIHVLRVCL